MHRLVPAVALLLVVALGTWAVLRSSDDEAAVEVPEEKARDGAAPVLITGASETDASKVARAAKPDEKVPKPDAPSAPKCYLLVTGPDGPVADAEFRLFRRRRGPLLARGRTDAQGVAPLQLLPGRAIEIQVRKRGFRVDRDPAYRNGEVAPDGLPYYELEVESGIPLTGHVVDAETEAPLEGARVTVNDWGLNDAVVVTDADGAFQFPGVMDDNACAVSATAPGHQAHEMTVRVDGGRVRPEKLVLALKPGGRLTGFVRAPNGDPVAGADVLVQATGPDDVWRKVEPLTEKVRTQCLKRYQYDDQILSSGRERHALRAQTKEDGSFVVDGLVFDKTYEAFARAKGFAASAVVGDIKAQRQRRAVATNLTLRASARVEVTLRLADGFAFSKPPRVRLFSALDPIKPTRGEGAGPYVFGDLPPGRYHVFADVKGVMPSLDEVVVSEGEMHAVELVPPEGALIEGVVVGPDGKPFARAEVSAARAADNKRFRRFLHHDRETESGRDGTFRISGLPPGETVLVASGYKERARFATRELIRFTAPERGIRVVLARQGEVKMRLLTPDGKPFAGKLWSYSYHGSGGGGGSRDIDDGLHDEIGLEDGEHTLIVAPAGYAWFRYVATIKDGQTIDLGDITLDQGVRVVGRAVDRQGQPVQGVGIQCVVWDNRQTMTDADGRFVLERFPNEPVEFQVGAEGFCDRTITLDPSKGHHEIRMMKPGVVVASIAHADGTVPADTWVTLRPEGAKPEKIEVEDENGELVDYESWENEGYIEFDAKGQGQCELTPGTYDVRWSPDEGEVRSLGKITIVEGENPPVRFVIPAK